MTSKRYALTLLGLVGGAVGIFIVWNFLADDFGLFWSGSPKRIWTLEKTSKYLMSYRYVPQNFDGLLLGPSYSDGLMDTRAVQGYRIYNLSMEGGNATELRAAAINALDRGHFRILIICLSPYITKDSGIKGSQINAKEYWGSLFSLLPFDVLMAKWDAYRDRAHDLLRDSDWGIVNIERRRYSWDGFVRAEYEDPLDKEVRIDPRAYADLKAVIDEAHKRGVRVLAYYFPNSLWRSESAVRDGNWSRYEAQVRNLLNAPSDVVWDMMTPDYDSLRDDAACYTDGHLSAAGARLALADINHELAVKVRGVNVPAVFPRRERFACLGQPGAGSGYDRAAK